MNKLVMEIEDFFGINKAEIEINKINVVGGVNGSGKSTATKILYSFLKANSTKRRDYAIQFIVEEINDIIDELDYEGNEYNLPAHLDVNNTDAKIMNVYNEILEIYEKHCELSKIKIIELNKELKQNLNDLIKKLEDDGFNSNEIINTFNKQFPQNDNYQSTGDKFDAFDEMMNIKRKFFKLSLFVYQLCRFESLDGEILFPFLISDETQEYKKFIDAFHELKREWDYFETATITFGPEDLLQRSKKGVSKRIVTFFEEDNPDLSRETYFEMLITEFIDGFSICPSTKFHVNLADFQYDAYDYFFENGFIDSIYYVDNMSIIDFEPEFLPFKELYHMNETLEALSVNRIYEPKFEFENIDSRKSFESNLDQDVENILGKIKSIIRGNLNLISFDSKIIKNEKETNIFSFNNNTASGIKQIGIIQLLLKNDKLKKDGFLIIDEPEVNLHPDWQFKFAEILVLLAKDLNITIYLNSHSPFFIEAIDAFTEFYDMQDDVNYYLTEESEIGGKYNFNKINQDELYKIYDNLGRPYDLIDQLRLQKHLGE